MRFTLFSFFIVFFQFTSAQRVISNDSALASGVDFLRLDSIYVKAMVMDPSVESAFKGRESEFLDSFKHWMFALMSSLNHSGFYWNDTLPVFNRIYFSKEGDVELWVYRFKDKQPITSKEQQFVSLTMAFCKSHPFPLKPRACFQQCSSTWFYDR